MMSAPAAINDDFQLPNQSKKKHNKKTLPRVYIGNLPVGVDHSELQNALPISNSTIIDVISGPKTCHAFVTCASNQEIDQVISALHQKQFQGRKLTAQRERKPKQPRNVQNNNGGNKKGSTTTNFGGWAKPAPVPAVEPAEEKMDAPVEENPFTGHDPAADSMAAIIQEELQAATTKEDVLNTTIASLAAVSFLAPMMGDDTLQTAVTNEESKDAESDDGDFMTRCKSKPLSELLEDYGDEDPDWQAVQPTLPAPEEPTENSVAPTPNIATQQLQPENRLGRHGKAPIHVEFVSFGYTKGAPKAIRNGWSHAQPLELLECRDLPPCPKHLVWRDGTSGYVARVLLAEGAKDMAVEVAPRVFSALVEAIDEGHHGYAAPLKMQVYVGSETGRHRSVVVCEQAAKQLRNLLRSNADNVITVPVSVGSFHRELEARNKKKPDKSQKEDLV